MVVQALPAIAGGLKALMASEHFIPMLIASGFLGGEVLGQVGKAGERGVAREQINLQSLLAESQAEATKRATLDARKGSKENMAALLKAKKEERKEGREAALLQSFMQGQDRQSAMLMQAIQGMTQTQSRSPNLGAGMLGLMRGNF